MLVLGLVVGANGQNGVGAALVEGVRVFAVAVAISYKGVEGARGIDEAGGVDRVAIANAAVGGNVLVLNRRAAGSGCEWCWRLLARVWSKLRRCARRWRIARRCQCAGLVAAAAATAAVYTDGVANAVVVVAGAIIACCLVFDIVVGVVVAVSGGLRLWLRWRVSIAVTYA